MDERQLIDRVLSGDVAAERELYDANVDRIYRLTFRMTGDPHLAESCTQDAFVRAFDRLEHFRGESKFSTWLHSVAVTVTIDELRKRKRIRSREVEVEELESVSPARKPADPGIKVRLTRAVDGLSEILRTVFVMHDIEGYKHEEIAEVLDIPEGTSKARLSRARAQLRETLGDLLAGTPKELRL